MRRIVGIIGIFMAVGLAAQPKQVIKSVELTNQRNLLLDFDFADQITFEIWEKREVLIEVMVEINDGEGNDSFILLAEKNTSDIRIAMDRNAWDKMAKDKGRNWDCNWQSSIDYKVFLPADLLVTAETISGDFDLTYYGTKISLKTISGAIDVTIPNQKGLDFHAKTISGEIFSDLNIAFPYGKEGLRQIVGQDIKGRVHAGGDQSEFKTISGNIYLRKG